MTLGTGSTRFTRRRGASASVAVIAGVLVALVLSACAPEAGETADGGPSSSASPTEEASASPTPIPTITAGASPSATGSVALPTDCRAILTTDVLAQLGDTPLNAAELGIPTGVQPDGTLICVWRDPQADTTYLKTTVSRVYRGDALEQLNTLADTEGFTCYIPDGGTRCEKSWPNATYPVTDGRTLFWKGDVLVDTQYSNLAPTGYTAAIVEKLFG